MTFAISSPSFSNGGKSPTKFTLRKRRTVTVLPCAFIALLTLGLAGCGGSGSGQPGPTTQAPAITSANNTTFTEGVASSFSVTATGAPTPSITESGTLPGGVTFNAGTLSGTPTASGTFNVTFTASNGVSPNAVQNFTLTVNPPALAVTTTSLPAGTVGTAYNQTLTATGGVTPYKWGLTAGSLPAGLSLSSIGVISGSPSAASTSSFTVTVADSESPAATATAGLSITITAQAAACEYNAKFSGGYAMILRGWPETSGGGVFGGVVGSFQVDGNGNITQGVVDMNSYVGPEQDTFTGSYCLASNNLGTITINPVTHPNPRTLAFSLQSDGNGSIMFYDTNADFCPGCGLGGFQGSGMLRKQQATAFSTSGIKGSYAFGFSGADGGAPSLAEAGVLVTDGNGNITSGEYDFNDGGQVLTGTISAGSVYSVASTGRGTATIISTASNPVNLVLYMVSASEVLFLQDDGAGSAVVAGQALLQTGPFTNSSLSGNMVIGIEVGGLQAQAGLISANGSGSLSISVDGNVGGTATSYTGTGNYLVDSNGRVALTNITSTSYTGVTWCMLTGGGEGCNWSPVFYLVSQNKAFIVGNGANASFGEMEPQTGSSFTNASLEGNFMGGTVQPAGPAVGEEADSVIFDGIGAVTGTAYQNGPGGSGIQSDWTIIFGSSLDLQVTLVPSAVCSLPVTQNSSIGVQAPCFTANNISGVGFLYPPEGFLLSLPPDSNTVLFALVEADQYGDVAEVTGSGTVTNNTMAGTWQGPIGGGSSGSGTFSGTQQPGLNASSSPITGTYTVLPNGRVVVTSSEQETVIYMISNSEFVALTTGLWNKSDVGNPYLVDFKK